MKQKTVVVTIVAVLVLMLAIVAARSSKEEGEKQSDEKAAEVTTPSKEAKPETDTKEPAKVDEVAILQTNYGTIVLEFFPKDAPGHVENFKKLARKGLYDGTKFHRVYAGFMIQGGDPLSKDDNPDNDGTGDPGYRIKAEFNERKHLKGTLSMARGQDINSAGSQFFICLVDRPGLDGKYTVFGQVLEGIEVVETIGSVKVKRNRYGEESTPVEPVILKKVTVVGKEEFVKAEKKDKKAEPEEGKKK